MKIEPYVTAKGGVVILNGPFPMKEAEAVRRLCASAPELLSMLKTLVNLHDGGRENGGDGITPTDWRHARRTIADAEGY